MAGKEEWKKKKISGWITHSKSSTALWNLSYVCVYELGHSENVFISYCDWWSECLKTCVLRVWGTDPEIFFLLLLYVRAKWKIQSKPLDHLGQCVSGKVTLWGGYLFYRWENRVMQLISITIEIRTRILILLKTICFIHYTTLFFLVGKEGKKLCMTSIVLENHHNCWHLTRFLETLI